MPDHQMIYDMCVRLDAKVDTLVREVAALKVKAGVWGALSGLAVGLGLWVGLH